MSVLFLLYGALLSVLASSAAKRSFAKRVGERVRNGLYRPLYTGQAVRGTLAATAVFRVTDLDDYLARHTFRAKPWRP